MNRVSKRRVLYDILYDACGTYETGVLASNVRRRSADGCPGHVSPFASNKGAGLGHEPEPSPVVPAPVSPQPLPPYDPLPGGMTGEPSRAKKKPRRAQDGTRLPKLAYRLGPEAPYRLGSVDGVKCVGCKEHDAEPPNLGDAKKPKTDVEAVSPPTRDARAGRWIEVYWAGDKVWYKGYVVGRKIINGAVRLSVTYIDGELHDEALQDEPFAGDGVPPDDRKPWYWRFAEPGEPPSSKKRSLPVTFRLGDAKKQKTDAEADADAEFEFDAPSPDNAKVLSLLADVAASHSAAKPTKGKQAKPAATTPTKKFKLDPFGCPDPVTEPPVYAKKHRL